jgi:lipopolysaccharide transport system ATP-binding protein
MTDDVIIRVENLSKKYIIGHEAERERYVALRDVVMRTGRNAWRKTSDLFRGRDIVAGDEVEEFWALKDVSFEVKRGEVLGIIGRNGAGKSTLLKVLSRITEPSEGRVTIKGRVASLLEVGTGFHPELSGRENIYLNGAILGMTRAEIRRKFDEIVAFAEVEKFLDTPVKRYSSGMYVRLAFAVAAHLEPEILVVDEVLAVGDVEFQKKCLGKMEEVAKGQGRTILFVSHNMAAIQSLCRTVIVLRDGHLFFKGTTGEGIDRHLEALSTAASVPLLFRKDRQGSAALRFVEVRFKSGQAENSAVLMSGSLAVMEIYFENNTKQDLQSAIVEVQVENYLGQRIAFFASDMVNNTFTAIPCRAQCIQLRIPNLPIMPGRYSFTLCLTINGVVADWIKDAGHFDVAPGDFYETGKLPPPNRGCVLVPHSFEAK